jgi:hypothetical protein
MSLGLARARVCTLAFACSVITAAPVTAQAWNYPSFNQPQIMSREFNFGLADGGDLGGTSLVFQWREGLRIRTEMKFDVGFSDPEAGDAFFIAGAGFGQRLAVATAEMPLDLVLTAGVYGAFGDFNLFRVPIGLSVGHRFPLEGSMAVTPYVHPRVSLDFCSDCPGDDDSDISINFDLGADLELSRQLSLRFAALFAGGDLFGDDDGFGISIAWRPVTLTPR